MVELRFKYPTGKSKEYTEFRQNTTNKYGNITEYVMLVFIVLIPLSNFLVHRGKDFWHRINLFRWANHMVSGVFREDNPSRARTLIMKLLIHANVIVQVGFWIILFSVLSLSDLNGGDLIFLAKRLGKICVVCLPTIMFLTLRPSPLPYTLYLSLVPFHKWLSRIVVLQSVIHVVLYCGFFQKNGTWEKAIKRENIYGWVAISGFIIMTITSFSKFRQRFYRFFYFHHYIWSWIIVGCLQIHARPVKITGITILNFAILAGQIIYRLRLTSVTMSNHDVKVIDISPTLSLIEFPNSLLTRPGHSPGAHVRLTEYHDSIFVRAFNQIVPNYHPYSLASLPQDNYQKLIVRKTRFQIMNNRKYLISGAYDPYLPFSESKQGNQPFSISKVKVHAQRVLIVIGGSAISFALPILRVMNYHGIPTKVVWVIKDFRDVAALRYFDGFIHGDDFEIFLTKEPANCLRISRWPSKYGSINESSISPDLEANIPSEQESSSSGENDHVDVEISVGDDEEDPKEEDCVNNSLNIEPSETFEDSINEDTAPDTLGHSSVSSRRNSSVNEPFVPELDLNDSSKYQIHQFKSILDKLNLTHKIYKGRPKINYKYYHWCLSGGFTQCSGPVGDGDHTICCRDLPINQTQSNIDLSKVWVISAGPPELVHHVKLWAKKNSLNFHDESFFV